MFAPTQDFHKALHQARVATRKRDFAVANRWMTLAERHARMLKTLQQAEKLERDMRPQFNSR